MVGTMVYMGLILVTARRQHEFGGNEFPDKLFWYVESMAPWGNQGVQDLLTRFCCAVPAFPAREWIMDHASSRTR